MNQNDIELCKTTGFWWVDRPEPLKNQSWQWSLDQTGEILRCKSYESNNTENIGFDQKNETRANKKNKLENQNQGKNTRKTTKKNCGKCRFLFCFFLVFLFFLVIFPVDLFFWWFCFCFCFFYFLAKIHFLCSTRGHNARERQKLNWDQRAGAEVFRFVHFFWNWECLGLTNISKNML